MREEDILLQPDEETSPFSGFLRPRRSRGPRIALIIIGLMAAAGAAWYFLRPADEAPPPLAVPVARTTPSETLASDVPIDLPAVDTSDAFMRRFIAGLSAHPQFAAWLVTDELVRRFVGTIADLAYGSSPTPHLRFMESGEPFRVRESSGNRVIDPTSYLRYNTIAATFASLDTEGTVRLIRRLHPLFDEAHAELGLIDRTFDGDLERAINNLLAVEVPARPPVVVRGELGWLYEDGALESRSAAAKHLMRMGPENALIVQTKLAELAAALGIQTPG